MSHRMSLLSRRFQRFAIGLSFATVAFFFIGLFAAAKHSEGQVVFLLAGLVSVCLFATILLWLAHGFAWAMIPEEPAEVMKPSEALNLSEAMRSPEAKRPAEAMKPAEPMKPAEAMKLAEPMKPAEPMKVAEVMKPAEAMKAVEEKKPVEQKKPAEEKVTVPKDPPGAKYTITGRRIS